MSDDDFKDNYKVVVTKYRERRYNAHREVNNRLWVMDTLNRMGIEPETYSSHVDSAVEKYFSTWRLSFVPHAPSVLKRLSESFKISLISNFTSGTFLRRSLKDLGIEENFENIIVSDEVGWRKPHPNIFRRFLKLSKVKATEAVFIGDELETDIKGAKEVGIKAVLLARNQYSSNDMERKDVFPDHTVKSLIEFERLILTKFGDR
jgi:HAD superfamily hydrolase (TIGR01549 family)